MKLKESLKKFFNKFSYHKIKAIAFIGIGSASIGYGGYDAVKAITYNFDSAAKAEVRAKATEGQRRADMKAVVLWDEALAMKEVADRTARAEGDIVGILLGLQVLAIGGAAADEIKKKKNPGGPAA